MVRVPTVPGCGIDWTRLHSLPVGVPPETLAAAERVQYANGIEASGEIPHSTYGRYFTEAPKQNAVRATPPGAGTRFVLPRHSSAPGNDVDLPAAAAGVVSPAAFSPRPPNAGTYAQVETELQGKVPHDAVSRKFAPLPIPFRDLDTIRFYFAPQAARPFAGTLGLNETGLFGTEAPLPLVLPATLLTTRQVNGAVAIGELDRLLLRAPVTGRFRFEPYYVYRWSGATFEAVGPSNSGRLLVQQPKLAAKEKEEKTDTRVFQERVFAFDHVHRESVLEPVRHALALQLGWVDAIVSAHKDEAGANPRLAILKSAPEVMGWVLTGVNSMLRAWTGFLAVLAWRDEDAAVAGAIPAAWSGEFPARHLKLADAKKLTDAVVQLRGQEAWLESLLFFLENVLAPRLAGFSWTEILEGNGQNPAVKRFPVPKDQPPFAPKNDAAIKQHQRLRLTEDPQFRWVACFAGSPLGKPSAVYAPAPSGSTAFPAGGLTTYELEVLHQAGNAHTALGLAAPVAGAGPQPGGAMDLTPYAAQATGHCCFFSAERAALHTTVDWLVELTRGIHFKQEEEGFVDLFALMDPATGDGHPLLGALRADEHNRAIHLRRQMDALEPGTLATDSLSWWDSKLGFATAGGQWQFTRADGGALNAPPSPRTPYREARTSLRAFPALHQFDDLVFGTPSGFDLFDIESAYMACGRMSDPIDDPGHLPVPVLLALMEREAVKLFGPINRLVRETTTEAATTRWEALRRTALTPAPRDRSDYPATDSEMSREAWLSYPYGLDTFAAPASAAAMDAVVTGRMASVLTLAANESPGRYIRDRVWASWFPSPAVAGKGLPRIWKRSRRMHWAALSLMAGFFRMLENQIRAPTVGNGFKDAGDGWEPDPADWLPAGSSPPDLTGRTAADPEWKDYLSYYGMIYTAYNAGAGTCRAFLRAAKAARPVASPLSHRDWLLFRHSRGRDVIGNMARFVIGLDAFLRLDWMAGKAPQDYATSNADTTAPSGRAWGV